MLAKVHPLLARARSERWLAGDAGRARETIRAALALAVREWAIGGMPALRAVGDEALAQGLDAELLRVVETLREKGRRAQHASLCVSALLLRGRALMGSDRAAACDHLDEAETVSRMCTTPFAYGLTQVTFADFYLAVHQTAKAAEYADRAVDARRLVLRRPVHLEDTPDELALREQAPLALGRCQSAAGDVDAAIDSLLDAHKHARPDDPLRVAAIGIELAEALLAATHFDEARAKLRDARPALDAHPAHPLCGRARMALVRLARSLGRRDDAFLPTGFVTHAAPRSLHGRVIVRQLGASRLDEGDRATVEAAVRRLEAALERRAIDEARAAVFDLLRRADRADSPSLRAPSYALLARLENGSGAGAERALRLAIETGGGADPITAALVHGDGAHHAWRQGLFDDALSHALRALAAVERSLARNASPELRSDLAEVGGASVGLASAALARSGRYAEAALIVERNRAPALAGRHTAYPSSERELREALGACTRDGAMLLALQPPSPDGLSGCVVARPGEEPCYVTLPAMDLGAMAVLHDLAASGRAEGWDEPLRHLSAQLLLAPFVRATTLDGGPTQWSAATLAELLPSVRLLRVIPTGVWNQCPFAALPRDDGSCLGETHGVLVAPRLDMHLPRPSAAVRSAKVLCNVDGDAARPLTFAAHEAAAVTGALSNAGISLQVESRWTVATYRERVREAQLIHLATHGDFDPGAPHRARVLLGRAGVPEEELDLLQVLTCPIEGRTVVLSACSTAATEPDRHVDALSLAASFLAAGAATVLATLWPVHDEAMAHLVRALYAARFGRGLGWASALQHAQASLREAATSPGGEVRRMEVGEPVETRLLPNRPYVWAAMTVFGANDDAT